MFKLEGTDELILGFKLDVLLSKDALLSENFIVQLYYPSSGRFLKQLNFPKALQASFCLGSRFGHGDATELTEPWAPRHKTVPFGK